VDVGAADKSVIIFKARGRNLSTDIENKCCAWKYVMCLITA